MLAVQQGKFSSVRQLFAKCFNFIGYNVACFVNNCDSLSQN